MHINCARPPPAVTSEIEIESFAEGVELRCPLSRAKFESLNMSHFNLCLDTVKSVLKDANLKKEAIDEVRKPTDQPF